MSALLSTLSGPADLRRLGDDDLALLARELREVIVRAVSVNGGHLGPNLGVVELTIALHRVFDSPDEPILFDVGHQCYPHKLLTGRAAGMPGLRTRHGLSGYPSRAESEHDWIENSHASTALSYADGLSKAFALQGRPRPVTAVVGDGSLTGGLAWEALNAIATGGRQVVVVLNDNGRSYAPTTGGLAARLAELRRDSPLDGAQRPARGRTGERLLRSLAHGVKDAVLPGRVLADLGLRYVGPVDGHDRPALEAALRMARRAGRPVLVHVVTGKGHGYLPAEQDERDRMHQSPPFDPATGRPLAVAERWTDVFGRELVRQAAAMPQLVAVTAAMRDPTGLSEFAARWPDRFFDVGIAEQHAVTSAAGLALAGLHPVVPLYATFVNRAFDQVLMDVALHRLPVTLVLDRAGVTGPDGPSHHGMWDLAVLGVVPGLRIAAPRDAGTLRAELAEALAVGDGPTVLRFPKAAPGAPIDAVRTVDGLDVLGESHPGRVDLLFVAVGATAPAVLDAAGLLVAAGRSVRVVDPRWVQPVPAALVRAAADAGLVVTVEDGVVEGGVGSRVRQALDDAGQTVPARAIGLPRRFLPHGTAAQILAEAGLGAADIAARAGSWCDALAAPSAAGVA